MTAIGRVNANPLARAKTKMKNIVMIKNEIVVDGNFQEQSNVCWMQCIHCTLVRGTRNECSWSLFELVMVSRLVELRISFFSYRRSWIVMIYTMYFFFALFCCLLGFFSVGRLFIVAVFLIWMIPFQAFQRGGFYAPDSIEPTFTQCRRQLNDQRDCFSSLWDSGPFWWSFENWMAFTSYSWRGGKGGRQKWEKETRSVVQTWSSWMFVLNLNFWDIWPWAPLIGSRLLVSAAFTVI